MPGSISQKLVGWTANRAHCCRALVTGYASHACSVFAPRHPMELEQLNYQVGPSMKACVLGSFSKPVTHKWLPAKPRKHKHPLHNYRYGPNHTPPCASGQTYTTVPAYMPEDQTCNRLRHNTNRGTANATNKSQQTARVRSLVHLSTCSQHVRAQHTQSVAGQYAAVLTFAVRACTTAVLWHALQPVHTKHHHTSLRMT